MPESGLRCTPIKYLITSNIDDNALASSLLQAVYSWGSIGGRREEIATAINLEMQGKGPDLEGSAPFSGFTLISSDVRPSERKREDGRMKTEIEE